MSGVEVLRAIHAHGNGVLDQLMYAVTLLGTESFYVLILPVFIWFYDKGAGRWLGFVFLMAYWSNTVLKDLFHTARPTPGEVRQLHPETGEGFAFPSGHSQLPLMLWGALALYHRRAWFSWAAGVLVVLIGLSRLYLGLHWPLDVLGGWCFGAIGLYLMYRTMPFWAGGSLSLMRRLFWAVLLPLGALGIGAVTAQGPIAKDMWIACGLFAGFLVGGVLEDQFVGFDPKAGGTGAQALKLVVGVALTLGVKEGFKFLLPSGGAGDMVRYALVGLVVVWGAPWVFTRFIARPPFGRTQGRSA
jgi:membrane-associated phospholipid phosphatase